jgi:hypothetical protein
MNSMNWLSLLAKGPLLGLRARSLSSACVSLWAGWGAGSQDPAGIGDPLQPGCFRTPLVKQALSLIFFMLCSGAVERPLAAVYTGAVCCVSCESSV